MSWKDLVNLAITLLGLGLILYGSTYFNAAVGWTGVCLIIGGLLVEVILYTYSKFKKKD